MLKKRILVGIAVLSLCTSTFSVFADTSEPVAVTDATATVTPIYKKISAENLKTLTEQEVTSDTSTLNDLISDEKDFIDIIKEKIKAQFNLDPHTKRQAIFNLLNKHEETHPIPVLDVLEDGTWKDLEILCGPKTKPSLYLAAKIDRTVTEVGRAMLYRKVIQPTDKMEDLVKQQQIIKTLVECDDLFNDLDVNLKKLSVPENVLLSFWLEDILSSLTKDSQFTLPFENKIAFLKKITKGVNKSERTLMAKSVFDEAIFILSMLIITGTVFTGPAEAISSLFGHKFYKYEDTCKECNIAFETERESGSILSGAEFKVHNFNLRNIPQELPLMSVPGVIERIIKNVPILGGGCLGDNQHYKRIVQVLAFCVTAWGAWKMCRWFNHGLQFDALFHKKLSNVATYIDSLNNMIQTIKSHSEICALMPQISELDKKIEELRQLNNDFDHLLNLLETNTLKGTYSHFSFRSRMDVAYRLMEQEKDKFDEIMIGIGELDAQMSIARLYKEMKGKRVEYCFPEYQVSTDGMAFVDINDFFHPCLDIEKAVANSINIHGKNIVITGPNAGGKSTIMKALVISIIMAQALGIAPASSMKFTPFSKIITYMNITDDIAAGNSHFKAGVMRARDVLREVDSVKEGQHAIAVVDEIFNGTTFKEGQAAAFSFINELGQKPSNIVITTTHFPMMANLAKTNDKFLNYKVYVNYDQNGKIIYTYKLEPGVSDQIVTLKILREEGFADKFIDNAEAVIEAQA